MSDLRRGVAFPIVILLGALGLPVSALGQSRAGTAVAERNVGADAADLDVKSFVSEPRAPPNVSTWRAVRESGQWRIRLHPCTSDEAMRPWMNQYQGLATASDVVNASMQQGKITNFSDAHNTLLKAERDALSANRIRQ